MVAATAATSAEFCPFLATPYNVLKIFFNIYDIEMSFARLTQFDKLLTMTAIRLPLCSIYFVKLRTKS